MRFMGIKTFLLKHTTRCNRAGAAGHSVYEFFLEQKINWDIQI